MSDQRFNTGNPIGSNSPLDRSDNTRNLDQAVNAEQDTFQDRLGKSRLTWAGVVKAGSGDPAIAVDAAQRAETAADNAADNAARAESAASQVQQDADQIAADAAQQAVTDVVNAVDGAVDQAEGAASRSETARDAAFVNADVYDDVATGRAAVANGEQFQVVSGLEIVRYRRDSSSSQTEVARYPAASTDALRLNRGKAHPFRQRIRGGVLTDGSEDFFNFFLDMRVSGPEEMLKGKIFTIAYMQNGYELSHSADAGIGIHEFDEATFESGGSGTIIHDQSDAPLDYDETSSGITTLTIEPIGRPGLLFQITVDLDAVPWGTSITAHTTKSPNWSFHIDPTCHSIINSKISKTPFRDVAVVNGDAVAMPDRVARIFKSITVTAPAEKLRGYVYRFVYLQNMATLAGDNRYGIRVGRYKVIPGGYDMDSEEWIHTPDHAEADYDITLGGVQSFTMQMGYDPDVTLSVTLDTDRLTLGAPITMWVSQDSPNYNTAIIDPSCYIPTYVAIPDVNPQIGIGLSGIGVMGASLIAYPSNYWVERAASHLDLAVHNKAEGGVGTERHFANLLWRGTFCTDAEFEEMDVLIIQFASSRYLNNEEGLKTLASDYTVDFDETSEDNPWTDLPESWALDYIMKRWRDWCYSQKDNPDSKWYGTPHGKPMRVMFVTHWHSARAYYNNPIRAVAEKWGSAVCELDKYIGFSNSPTMPNGDPASIMYAEDEKSGYGWHPLRGDDGKYIQGRMAGALVNALTEWFRQV